MNKFERARNLVKELGLDCWLITSNEDNDLHSEYMLGVRAHSRHFICIPAQGDPEIMISKMEASMVQSRLQEQGIKANIQIPDSPDGLKNWLKKHLDNRVVALNYGEDVLFGSNAFADHITYGVLMGIKNVLSNANLVSASDLVYKLRSIKTDAEIKDLKEAVKITAEILEDVPNWVRVGMTEREIRARIETEYLKVGEVAFETIVATGKNSANPHHNTSNVKIKPGPLLIDTGAKINSMCADITWTFWVGGKPPDNFVKAYSALLKAKKAAYDHVKSGVKARLPATKCRESLADNGYDVEKLFIHGLGHPLGFEVHDIGPRLSVNASESDIIEDGMVYTNEPGLYWDNKWGIRLEDDFIVRHHHAEVTIHVPKEPPVI
ncbi:MAG: M24 family metallopeptidase [Promethearchaeota archaeon]